MKFPAIHGVIDRRILVNYTADPDAVHPMLPPDFRPRLYNNKAIVGICLIRLKEVRPKGFPAFMGFSSENAAHRIAVEWKENDIWKAGVYIPRRDTSSKWNAWAGGRIFPGKHYITDFKIEEADGNYSIESPVISVAAKKTDRFPADSVFRTLDAASGFFETGVVGYSPGNKNRLEGLALHIPHWKVQPLEVLHLKSGFFENRELFGNTPVVYDNALLMTNIVHEWAHVEDKFI